MQEIQKTQVQSVGWGDPLEEGMATHSSILAWRIPWTEEPGGYSSQSCKEWDTTEVTEHIILSSAFVDVDVVLSSELLM